jgi:serine kinase of HPr protein (carbohydrate metabolism regulator)
MVPVAIAGLIEIRGYGIVRLDQSRWKPSTELALAVSLGPIKDADRVADPDRVFPLHGVTLPELALPESSVEIAANAVLAWLGLAGRVI